MIMSYMVMVSKNDLEPLGFVSIILGSVLLGIAGTLLYGTCVHISIKRSYHIYAVKKEKVPEVIDVPESPLPTRSTKLLSSESHRRMAQSHRARRRGGRARHGDHRRACTRVYNPATKDDCGYSCVLKGKGMVINESNVREMRHCRSCEEGLC